MFPFDWRKFALTYFHNHSFDWTLFSGSHWESQVLCPVKIFNLQFQACTPPTCPSLQHLLSSSSHPSRYKPGLTLLNSYRNQLKSSETEENIGTEIASSSNIVACNCSLTVIQMRYESLFVKLIPSVTAQNRHNRVPVILSCQLFSRIKWWGIWGNAPFWTMWLGESDWTAWRWT